MEIQDFAREYQSKTDVDLLRLALDFEDLTPEARLALQTELSRRQINTPGQLEGFRSEEARRNREIANNPGKLWVIHSFGVGRMNFGKADYKLDSARRVEQFRTTIFAIILCFPLIPLGTYRIERPRQRWNPNDFTVIEKLPLDWGQVTRIWVLADMTVIAAFWGIGVLTQFLGRHR